MPSPNAETVRRLYEGWTRGDFAVDMDAFDPGVEFEMAWIPDRITSRGLDGMAAAWRDYLRTWQEFTTGAIEQLVEEGDTIAVLNRIRGCGKHSNVPVENLNAAVFTFRDLDERVRVVRLDDRADRPRGPTTGFRAQLDHVVAVVSRRGHHP